MRQFLTKRFEGGSIPVISAAREPMQIGTCHEAQAAGGEFIDVRRLDLRGTKTTEFGAKVIDGDEQNVRPLSSCGGGEQD